MKKILTIAIALVMALSLMVGAAANTAGTDAIDNMRDLVAELAEAVGGLDVLAAIVNDFFVSAGIDVDEELPEGADEALNNTITAHLIANGHNEDGRLVSALNSMFSSDFMNFLARLYIPCWENDPGLPPMGDSNAIAIAAAAVVALAGAGAFVVLKKKEEK
ncbi:MAG: LPXTG cell wall anchor domain-containing protein [Oscillospiraceae bacterium]|nr:LPXTG cell wall anchor domain-containing protein [Oscillospiraceae bacterium]